MKTEWETLLEELREADNSQVRSVASDLVKALGSRVEGLDDHVSDLYESGDVLAKAVQDQAEQFVALRKEIRTLKKALLTVARRTEKATSKRAPAGPSLEPADILAKANAAAETGCISWREYAGVDAALRHRQKIDDSVLSRIDGEPLEKSVKAGKGTQDQPATSQDAGLLDRAEQAAETGKITWREYASVDAATRMQQPVDPTLLERIDEQAATAA